MQLDASSQIVRLTPEELALLGEVMETYMNHLAQQGATAERTRKARIAAALIEKLMQAHSYTRSMREN